MPRFRAYRGSSYGVDLVKIDRFGWRATGIAPGDLAAYQIYGEPVFAPCAGKILQAIDGLPDMQIPQIDAVNRSGNHVILRCGDIDVLLAHFRPQSLSVRAGTDVRVGRNFRLFAQRWQLRLMASTRIPLTQTLTSTFYDYWIFKHHPTSGSLHLPRAISADYLRLGVGNIGTFHPTSQTDSSDFR